jgi:hypothetical protein
MNQSTYIPGTCNINSAEVGYRRRAMWFGIGASIFVLIALLVLNADWWIAIVCLFVPVYTAAISYLQVRNRFCVAYGSSGMQNAEEGSLSASDVSDDEARRKDMNKTWRMNAQALAMTVSVLAVCVLIFAYVL